MQVKKIPTEQITESTSVTITNWLMVRMGNTQFFNDAQGGAYINAYYSVF
jgi:hypothetical protein